MTLKEKAALCSKTTNIPESKVSAAEVFRENRRFQNKSVPSTGNKIIDAVSSILAVIIGIVLIIRVLEALL